MYMIAVDEEKQGRGGRSRCMGQDVCAQQCCLVLHVLPEANSGLTDKRNEEQLNQLF